MCCFILAWISLFILLNLFNLNLTVQTTAFESYSLFPSKVIVHFAVSLVWHSWYTHHFILKLFLLEQFSILIHSPRLFGRLVGILLSGIRSTWAQAVVLLTDCRRISHKGEAGTPSQLFIATSCYHGSMTQTLAFAPKTSKPSINERLIDYHYSLFLPSVQN